MYTTRYKSHHDATRRLKDRFEVGTDKSAYVADLLRVPPKSRRVVYLHVPFCNKICSFCPFHRPDELRRREYDAYLLREIEAVADFPYMRAPVNAVNFGGGTPTALLPAQMERVLTALHRNFDIPPGTEISVESSVSELTDEMTDVLLRGGVNRLSVGVQTFQDNGRALLGRRGSGENAIERLKKVRQAGFVNVGIDLIYNYPGQTERSLLLDLDTIRSLDLAGVSFYSLMLHDKTPLGRNLPQAERERMADTRRELAFFEAILDELKKSGYEIFELTKLIRGSLDRYEYMRVHHAGGSCIAIGHGAGGNLDDYVYRNSCHAPALSQDLPVSSMGRVLSPTYRIMDEFVNDLQKTEVSLSKYAGLLGFDIGQCLSDALIHMEQDGFVLRSGDGIRLTHKGIFWGNNMIDELVGLILCSGDFS